MAAQRQQAPMQNRPLQNRPLQPRTLKNVQQRRISPIGAVAGVIVILIVIGIIYALLPSSGVSGLGTGQTFTLAPNQSAYFTITSGGVSKALVLQSASNGTATMYVGTVPILSNPVVRFTLASGSSINISSTGSGVADLHVGLTSASSTSAKITVSSVNTGLGLRSSPSAVVIYPAVFTPTGVKTSNSSSGTTVSTVTSTVRATTSGPSVSSISVSVTSVTVMPTAQVYLVANSTAIGALMANYSALFSADAGCDESTYNTTFTAASGTPPSAAFATDYANASEITPYGMSTSFTEQSSSVYTVSYNMKDHLSSFNSAGLLLKLNLSNTSAPIVNETFKGYWYGQTYSNLYARYINQTKLGGDCEAWVTVFK